ncbi:TetR/AcrR family transcriptional regulator [Arcanobacterium hippocoleae]
MIYMPLGRKTGPKPKFSAEQVISAALEIGLDRFTMAQVAKAVGVGAPSLYRIYESREDLVGACLGEIARREPWVSLQQAWPDMLREWAHYCWHLCETYSGFALTLYTYPFPQVRFMEAAPGIIDEFISAGLDKSTVLFALDFVGDTVITIHLGLACYRVDRNHPQQRMLLARNIEITNRQLGVDVSPLVNSTNVYSDFVSPKVDFIIAALERGFGRNIQV